MRDCAPQTGDERQRWSGCWTDFKDAHWSMVGSWMRMLAVLVGGLRRERSWIARKSTTRAWSFASGSSSELVLGLFWVPAMYIKGEGGRGTPERHHFKGRGE